MLQMKGEDMQKGGARRQTEGQGEFRAFGGGGGVKKEQLKANDRDREKGC